MRFFAFSRTFRTHLSVQLHRQIQNFKRERGRQGEYKRVSASSVARTRNKTTHRYTHKKLQELVASRLCIHRGDGGGGGGVRGVSEKASRGTKKKKEPRSFPWRPFFSFSFFPRPRWSWGDGPAATAARGERGHEEARARAPGK